MLSSLNQIYYVLCLSALGKKGKQNSWVRVVGEKLNIGILCMLSLKHLWHSDMDVSNSEWSLHLVLWSSEAMDSGDTGLKSNNAICSFCIKFTAYALWVDYKLKKRSEETRPPKLTNTGLIM